MIILVALIFAGSSLLWLVFTSFDAKSQAQASQIFSSTIVEAMQINSSTKAEAADEQLRQANAALRTANEQLKQLLESTEQEMNKMMEQQRQNVKAESVAAMDQPVKGTDGVQGDSGMNVKAKSVAAMLQAVKQIYGVRGDSGMNVKAESVAAMDQPVKGTDGVQGDSGMNVKAESAAAMDQPVKGTDGVRGDSGMNVKAKSVAAVDQPVKGTDGVQGDSGMNVKAESVAAMDQAVKGTDGARGYSAMHTHEFAFHYLNTFMLEPKLAKIFNKKPNESLNSVFARELAMAASKSSPSNLKVLSIGSGTCSTEMEITELLKAGHNISARFVCYEPSEEGFQGARKAIKERQVEFTVTKQLSDYAGVSFDAVFIHHALHHVTDLETVLDFLLNALGTEGSIVIADMITSSGHRRWPEQLELAKLFFAKLQQVLGRPVHDYIADCDINAYPDYAYHICDGKPHPANEGVRSGDIMPLLLQKFHFSKFVAFGGISFEFFGHRLATNFNGADPTHLQFIKDLADAQEEAVSTGRITPDQMIAVLQPKATKVLSQRKSSYWKDWSPTRCTRFPSHGANSLTGTIPALDPCRESPLCIVGTTHAGEHR